MKDPKHIHAISLLAWIEGEGVSPVVFTRRRGSSSQFSLRLAVNETSRAWVHDSSSPDGPMGVDLVYALARAWEDFTDRSWPLYSAGVDDEKQELVARRFFAQIAYLLQQRPVKPPAFYQIRRMENLGWEVSTHVSDAGEAGDEGSWAETSKQTVWALMMLGNELYVREGGPLYPNSYWAEDGKYLAPAGAGPFKFPDWGIYDF